MKGLANLIRVHKWKLDEKRRELADFENLRSEFSRQLLALQSEQQREQDVAGKHPEVHFSYANYASATKAQQDNLRASIAEIEQKITMLNEEVADCFQELKKYEIALDVRRTEMAYERSRAEQAELDDLAIDLHRRKSY